MMLIIETIIIPIRGDAVNITMMTITITATTATNLLNDDNDGHVWGEQEEMTMVIHQLQQRFDIRLPPNVPRIDGVLGLERMIPPPPLIRPNPADGVATTTAMIQEDDLLDEDMFH